MRSALLALALALGCAPRGIDTVRWCTEPSGRRRVCHLGHDLGTWREAQWRRIREDKWRSK